MVGELPNIGGVLESNELSSKEAIVQIEQWVEQYPACSAYRFMLAKAYKLAEKSQAQAKLEIASLYAADREALYHFMVYGAATTILPEEEESKDVVLEPAENVVEEQDIKAGFVIDGEIQKAEKPMINFDEVVKYDPTKDLKPLEKIEKAESLPLDIEYTPVYNPEVELAKLAETHKEQEEESDKDFLYWLNHVDEDGTEDKEVIKQAEQSTSSNVDEVTDLLERFLINSKRRQPKEKREFFNAEEKAKRSEKDDSNLVSESLAKLYVKQELFDKALETYRKLSLQIPEKSAYFAARFKEVEEQRRSKEE